ncbi:hypothetical protein BKA70DRAFT_1430256 [Coprinopsis sp. MPI-PUGE-AT-0042]|nr:hypothetical protein BKA70DRAFT_1430256 [Coprinopsis sp. MPI-PUGE-AT-0042]
MQLPHDILESIISLIDTRLRASDLCNCALASRELVAIAQKKLLASVRLIQRVNGVHGEDFVVATHPIDRFHSSLLRNPSLGAYVRALEIHCTPKENHPSPEGFDVLQLLGNVQTLQFGFTHGATDLGWTRSWSEPNLDRIKSTLASLVTRNPIVSMHLFGIQDLAPSFITLASSLKQLIIQHVDLDTSASAQSSNPITIQLDAVELLENVVGFVKAAILTSFPILDISQVTQLYVYYGLNDGGDPFCRVLPLLTCIEVLDIRMESHYPDGEASESWAKGKTLSRLSPSALQTLHTIKLTTDVWLETDDFPVFGGLAAELAQVAGHNSLQEIAIEMEFGSETTFYGDLSQWAELDEILSNGFPYLRKLHVKVTRAFDENVVGYLEAEEGARGTEEEWEDLFREKFPWCRDNLHFVTEVEGLVVS